jgi:two-component system, response regulator, stage 0 sporulation protein F
MKNRTMHPVSATGRSPSPPHDRAPDDAGLSATHAPVPVRVLVIDDDLDFREALVDLLGIMGWDAEGAASGEEGLNSVLERVPDVLLLDHRMPGLSGADVVERLRTEGIEVPIVFMTAAMEGRSLARQLGLALYVPKPCSFDELCDAVRRALDGES